MALTPLHWRMLPPIFVANPSIGAFMDAVYTAGTSLVYADGTTRTPGTFASPGTASLPASVGTGSAWTWNYDATTFATGQKTACYAYPPTTTAINQALIVAGTTSVTGAVFKQMNGDSRSATYPFVGLAKNSGTYTSWNNATTPFTSGDFTGFGIFGLPASNYNTLLMWESEEAVIIQLVQATGAGTSGFIAGAVVDPLSANTANAETDGRLYGVSCTGSANYMSVTWLSLNTVAAAPFFVHSATANDPHSNTFTPGAGTLTATWRFGTFAPSTQFVSRNGDLPEIPFQIFDGSTKYLGQLRQIYVTRDGYTGVAWNVGSTPKGYLLGYTQTSAAGDCVLLAY